MIRKMQILCRFCGSLSLNQDLDSVQFFASVIFLGLLPPLILVAHPAYAPLRASHSGVRSASGIFPAGSTAAEGNPKSGKETTKATATAI